MSLNSTKPRNNYAGNGTTNEYSYDFKIIEKSNLKVIIEDSDSVETVLELNTDYSVDGVGTSSGGSITLIDNSQEFIDASGYLKSGYTLTILRVVTIEQQTDIRNQGDFFPETHEDAFDKSIMIDQQQQDELDRSIKLSDSSNISSFSPQIPSSFIGEGSVAIVTNEDGSGFKVGPTVSEISTANSSAVAAAASATAAAASETNAATSETNASNSASAAATSETNAGNSETAAATSASNAATSETNAATSASNASTSETNAASSATTASTAATAAETAKTDIETLLSESYSSKETLNNNATNTDLSIEVDSSTHDLAEIILHSKRGSSRQSNHFEIKDGILDPVSQRGNIGVSYDVSTDGTVTTLNYSTTDDVAGEVRYKVIRYEV